jgi:hypothetical protein
VTVPRLLATFVVLVSCVFWTATATAQAPAGLAGRWQSPDSVVEIKTDGSLTIDGTPYRYTVQGSVLTLIGYDGSVPVPFRLEGDTLTVSLGGEAVTLQRIRPGQTPGAGGSGGGGIADLAGKWCYVSNFTANVGGRVSDECFTISRNGTYSYHRETSSSGAYGSSASQEDDSGTISLSGSTLTVQSRAQGTLTYQLVKRNHPKTNDPMLCLSGQCFVTFGPRAPWR